MRRCIICYKSAVKLSTDPSPEVTIPFMKREGNAWNELGVYLMQMAQHELEKSGMCILNRCNVVLIDTKLKKLEQDFN